MPERNIHDGAKLPRWWFLFHVMSGKRKKGLAKGRTPKTHAGGRWTYARYRTFITSALRSASGRWSPKYDAINAAFVRKDKVNGRVCHLHRCASCGGLFPKSKVRADHIEPVVDPEIGFTTWDDYIARLFCEASGFQALCDPCHDAKTAAERERRMAAKRRAKTDDPVVFRQRKRP